MAGSIRPRAASAVAKLKQYGDHDEAAAIESLLGPRGYLLLKRTEEGSTEALSITITTLLKQAITETAESWDLVLDSLAEEAYRKVRDERWVPPEAGRAVAGSGGVKAVLQVNVNSDLRSDVQGMLAGLKDEVGYRVTEANIVLTHVCEELGIERPNTAVEERLSTRVPLALREHFTSEAERLGLDLQQVTEEGIRSLLAGDWSARQIGSLWGDVSSRERAADGTWLSQAGRSWSASEKTNLRVRVDKRLLSELRGRLDDLSERHGRLVTPGGVLRAILTERLGEPAV
ncbi:hypothetical protein ACWEGQ_00035 [Streptomyces seoulensis]